MFLLRVTGSQNLVFPESAWEILEHIHQGRTTNFVEKIDFKES